MANTKSTHLCLKYLLGWWGNATEQSTTSGVPPAPSNDHAEDVKDLSPSVTCRKLDTAQPGHSGEKRPGARQNRACIEKFGVEPQAVNSGCKHSARTR